jgi:hypothetical protein
MTLSDITVFPASCQFYNPEISFSRTRSYLFEKQSSGRALLSLDLLVSSGRQEPNFNKHQLANTEV